MNRNTGEIVGYSTDVDSFDIVVEFADEGWMLKKNHSVILVATQGKYYLPQSTNDVMRKIDTSLCAWLKNKSAIKKIIEEAAKQKHGTGLIFTNCAGSEVDRLDSCGRCSPIWMPKLCDHPEYILPLSSVDGALLITDEGNCVAYGAILDGVATVKGLTSRGARYNSLCNYVAWKKKTCPDEKYLAVIISEDGTIEDISTDMLDLEKHQPDTING